MYKPVSEIAEIIEKQENCKILITKGGSGNLYRSIVENKIGDLYLPGSEDYISRGINEGYVKDTVFVGINKAAIFVKNGNPKNVPQSIECLTDTNYRILIGNPNSGSIGEETKKILTKIGIYEKVKNRVKYQTIDSRDLNKAIKNNDADIVINWYATSTWENNSNYVKVLNIKNKDIFETKKLYIGLLIFSQQPDIAKKFMQYATSKKGNLIFAKYGLYFDN